MVPHPDAFAANSSEMHAFAAKVHSSFLASKSRAYQTLVAPYWSVEQHLINSTNSQRHIRLNVHRWRNKSTRSSQQPHLVLWAHGGGMVMPEGRYGDPSIELFRAFGPALVVVDVDYALAPQHPCPAAAQDTIDAFEWAHEHAADLGASTPLTMLGSSAGGNLAAVVAQHAARHNTPLRSAAVLWPMIHNSFTSASYSSFVNGPGLTTDWMRFFWMAYCPTAATNVCDDWRCTPLTPGKQMLASLASTHAYTDVITCASDVLRDDGREYAAAMRAAGVQVNHIELEGGHGCLQAFKEPMRSQRMAHLLPRSLGVRL